MSDPLDIEVPRWATRAILAGSAILGCGIQIGMWLSGHTGIISQLNAQQQQIDSNQKILVDHLKWSEGRNEILLSLDRKVTILAKLRCLEVDDIKDITDRRLANVMCDNILGNQIPGQ